jgi:phosphatidylserine/phosphatidylglycerophosphate/cardiolipin synthase-like enzyme
MTVLIDPKHAISHNKVMVIDERVVVTGSFNFSSNAEDDNAENLLVIEDKKELTAAYLKNFADHEGHAVPYKGLGKADAAPPIDEKGGRSAHPP